MRAHPTTASRVAGQRRQSVLQHVVWSYGAMSVSDGKPVGHMNLMFTDCIRVLLDQPEKKTEYVLRSDLVAPCTWNVF